MKFLVADDDLTFRTRLVRALASRGLQAYAAASGREAMELARQHRPERAVVDLRLGAESGLEVIKELSAADPQMQIVVLTGYGSIATAVEALRRGAVNYLSKPADAEQILAAFAPHPAEEAESTPSLARVEWEHIQRILVDCNNNISEAARRLGIHRRSLQRKLSKLPPLE